MQSIHINGKAVMTTALYKAQAKYDQIAAIVCQVDARFAERQGWDEQLATAAEELIAAEQLDQDESDRANHNLYSL